MAREYRLLVAKIEENKVLCALSQQKEAPSNSFSTKKPKPLTTLPYFSFGMRKALALLGAMGKGRCYLWSNTSLVVEKQKNCQYYIIISSERLSFHQRMFYLHKDFQCKMLGWWSLSKRSISMLTIQNIINEKTVMLRWPRKVGGKTIKTNARSRRVLRILIVSPSRLRTYSSPKTLMILWNSSWSAADHSKAIMELNIESNNWVHYLLGDRYIENEK